MASNVTLEGIKKAVFFPFRGEKWGIKVLIGSALGFATFFIPILPILPIFGYFGRIMHGIIVDDEDPTLPEWKDWGALFVDGIKLFGAYLIYLLPSLILTVGGYVVFMLLDFFFVISATNSANTTSSSMPLPMLLGMGGMFAGLAVAILGMVLMYITLIFIPPAMGNMIAKGEFSAAFRFKEWWPVFKANLSGYLIALVITLGLFTVMYFVVFFLYASIILCFLLPFALCFIYFIFGTLGFSLFALAYRDGLHLQAA